MNLIVIHKNTNSTADNGSDLLQFAVSSELIAGVIFDGLSKNFRLNGDADVLVTIPERWAVNHCLTSPKVELYGKDIPLSNNHPRLMKRNPWLVVSNGRFATQIDSELLDKVLSSIQADVVAVDVKPGLMAYREKVRLTSQGKVAGFRRVYSDFAESIPVPADWPHHIFVKISVLGQVLDNFTLPQAFSAFLERCRLNNLTLRAISIAGTVLDLGTEEGLLGLLKTSLNGSIQSRPNANNEPQKKFPNKDTVIISLGARLFGKVLFGDNVSVGQNAIIMGPTIIGNNVKVGGGAVITSSIIGSEICIPSNQLVQNRVIKGPQPNWKRLSRTTSGNSKQICCANLNSNHHRVNDTFRVWPRLSYARRLKRIADVTAAIVVLVLFAPIMPFIALAIKLNSPGPVFFRDNRQGRHGKEFCCLKFRTMTVGADKMQDKLRVLNQADGPQFKMKDDPRLSSVGRFLRDTYLDEIPQFLNVLLGHMSVVGPRPSPEAENTLCPPWRDARLSVRPGITGLWQVCRTRQPMRDFQEWIHYDIKYVRELSLKIDMWICWQTVKKLIWEFAKQF